MKKSAIVDGGSYVVSLWLMMVVEWLAADYCSQSCSVGDICELVLIPRTFSLWDCGTKWKLLFWSYVRVSMRIVGPSSFHVDLETLKEYIADSNNICIWKSEYRSEVGYKTCINIYLMLRLIIENLSNGKKPGSVVTNVFSHSYEIHSEVIAKYTPSEL